ncbi:MAG: hypothetical protein ACOCSA_02135 [Candidatus Hadarchaeota archaeon]
MNKNERRSWFERVLIRTAQTPNGQIMECPYCKSSLNDKDKVCKTCGRSLTSQELKLQSKVNEYREKRDRMLAIFAIGIFAIMIVPIFRAVLMIIIFAISLPLCVFYSWKKRKFYKALKEKLDISSL